jgi:hypothetical protein
MPANRHTPLLLVDVDGVLSLFGAGLDIRSGGVWTMVDGIPHLLSKRAGEHLRDLSAEFDCVWCTGWEEKADEYLRAAFGLREPWPHLRFERPPSGAHWKLAAIDAYADARRPLAWIDDTFDDSCRTWAATRPGPTLLVPTRSAVGLTDREAGAIRRWAARLGGGPAWAGPCSGPPEGALS